MRYLSLLMITGLLIFSCSQQPTGRILKGTISCSRGDVPTLSHIHLLKLGDIPQNTLKTVRVSKSGYFEIRLPNEIYLDLMITASDHKALQIPLITDDLSEDIVLDVRLEHNKYGNNFSDVRIIGDWNKFRFSQANPMRRQHDGSYLFETETTADSVSYQLVNLTTDGRSVNGTMSDYLVYDGGGDYHSVVNIKDGKIKITFNPADLKRVPSDQAASIKFEDGGSVLQQIATISMEYNMAKNPVNKSGYSETLKEKMENADNPLISRFAALQLARLTETSDQDAVETYKTIAKILPITDPLWAIEAYNTPKLYIAAFGEENAQQMFNLVYPNIRNKLVRTVVLAEIGLYAKTNNDIEKQKAVYHELKLNYKDIPVAGYFSSQLDPENRIAKGKPVPDFSVRLLNSDEIVSNNSLQGRFYMIDFWATWCGPCVREMPLLHDAFKKFSGPNFTIVSLSFDREKNHINTFRKKEWKMPWLHSYIAGEERTKLSKDFEVMGIPKPLLVNPAGIIVATESELRGEKLEKTLMKYLK